MLEWLKQFEILLVAIFHLKRPHVAPAPLQIYVNRLGVARVLHRALHVRVAPAGVDPQFHIVEPLDLAVERLDHEFYFVVVLP